MLRLNVALDPTKSGPEAGCLEDRLREMIVGQDEAVQQIVNIYQMHFTGMARPGRPIGNLLFVGPTGSGKTRVAEATAEVLADTPLALIKIDCAEFQHSHEVAKLIGSPPGYVGHRETHPVFTQEVLNRYHSDKVKLSFVLFDEVEKASDALWNLLLGILDKATLTLGDNRKVDFSRTLIFMTSNTGAHEMSSILSPRLGFNACGALRTSQSDEVDARLEGRIKRTGEDAVSKKFTPEFINRLDKIVTFKVLGSAELLRILDVELNIVQQRLFNREKSFVLRATDPAKRLLLREGTDMKYGARPLKRAIDRLILQPVSNLIATGQIQGGDWIDVDFADDQASLIFVKRAEGLPIRSMADLIERAIQIPERTVTNAQQSEDQFAGNSAG